MISASSVRWIKFKKDTSLLQSSCTRYFRRDQVLVVVLFQNLHFDTQSLYSIGIVSWNMGGGSIIAHLNIVLEDTVDVR